jgi:hypothetical protein
VYLFNICDSSAPGMAGDVYHLPYAEAVEGKRHGYAVEHKSRITGRRASFVEWTRNAGHPPDPKCPECHNPTPPPAREDPAPRKRISVHVPPENLVRYRRLMNLARHVERIGNQRSNRGDYAGANRAWSRASRISADAQTLRVPGRNGS